MLRATSFVAGLGLGAGLMYFLDPERGRRRRKLLLDQAYSAMCEVSEAADATCKDVSNRAYGFFVELCSPLSAHDNSDRVVVERVRSKLGRCVSHPAAIDVTAHDGCVTLSGPVLASEAQPLVSRVKSITGVKTIENRLDVHSSWQDPPTLQGTGNTPWQVEANG